MVLKAEDYTVLKHQIIQCLQHQEESTSTFKKLIRNKDIIILLGNTRSGKSTLANYLLGNKLIAWEEKKKIFKIKANGDCEGPEIGQGSLSCTTIPGVYTILRDTDDNVIIDSPGFEDNRGVVQDVINALCVNQIKAARSVKFVLVFDITDITNDSIKPFIHALQQTQKLVCNFDELKNSFCAIFMKDFRNYAQDDIIELFISKILNVEGLDIDKKLVRNFVQNKKLIGIFKMPEQAGEVSSSVEVNVKDAIKECHQVDVDKCEICFALSDKAEEILSEIYLEYTDTHFFEEQISKTTEKFADYFNVDKYVYASYDEELKRAEENLTIIAVSLLKHAYQQRSELSQVLISLDQLLEHNTCNEFKANFEFIIMLDDYKLLEEKHKNMIMANYVNFLLRLHEKVSDLLQEINAEVEERRKYKIKFGLAGGASTIGFVSAAVAGTARILGATVGSACATAEVATAGAATIAVCVIGAAACGAGIGIAALIYHEHYGKRKQARRAQGRKP
ncbi:hypothetical protein ILUMI_20769 [Ignelater luminosus]|uniref:G domain-containing protein n=1 Tax=Ignelater luminosus TaxID=2038154 RepID=A0A8K0CFV1_IGNLU|nr:hypothetical protein ILUMI_20769 [Ignelater luminosus]